MTWSSLQSQYSQMSKCLSREMIIIDPETFWGLAESCGGDKELSVELANMCLNVYFLIFFCKIRGNAKTKS